MTNAADTCEGSLIVEGKPLNLNQWLRYKEPSTFNLFRHCGSVRIGCFISNVSHTRNNAWILQEDMLKDLERMMGDLQTKADNSHKAKKLEKGRSVCARYAKDGELYRAKITNIHGKKAEIQYMDFGNSESVSVNGLLELPKQFILHPGFAMKVAIDNKDECRLLTAEEMDAIISDGVKLTAELVQPRLNIVRLYLGGVRVGYLPAAAAGKLKSGGSSARADSKESSVESEGVTSLLPLPRFRIGSEEMALNVLTEDRNTLVLQNVTYLKKLHGRIETYSNDLEPITSETIKENQIYLYKSADNQLLRVRLLNPITDIKSVDEIKFLSIDFASTITLMADQFSVNLFTCPDQLLAKCPAAVRVSAVNNRDQYQLINQLFSQLYCNKMLTLKSLKLDVRFKEAKEQENETFSHTGTFPNITINISKMDLVNNFDVHELSNIRDQIIDHYLNGTKPNLQSLEDHTKNDEDSNETLSEKQELYMNTCPIPSMTPTFQPMKVNLETKTISVHNDLPSIALNVARRVTIKEYKDVSLVTLADQDVVDTLKNGLEKIADTFEALETVTEDSIALFKDVDCGDLSRCVVLQVVEKVVRIYLIDSGHVRYCDIEELRSLPASLRQISPLVVPVGKIYHGTGDIQHHMENQEIITAKFVCSEEEGAELELEISDE